MENVTGSLPLAVSSWDEREEAALMRVIRSGQFTMGHEVRLFEQAFAEFVGTKHAVMVNSGSSANLLAVSALRYHSKCRLQPGDEIIVPAVSWGTTYYPVSQNGFVLKFVDVSADDWNLDIDLVAEAITSKTRAVFAVNLLGAPVDYHRLRTLCAQHDLVLLEDNCESLGATLDGRQAGSFGLAGTHSGFFSHHICTMEGGVVTTDDDEFRDLVVSLRAHGWLRGLGQDNHVHPFSGDPFEDSFKFVLPGYNLRPLEMSGAVGQEQLRKLPEFLRVRRKNAEAFLARFETHPHVDVQRPRGESSWFGFGMRLKGSLFGRRRDVVAALNTRGVECRPVVAGNFTKNPVMQYLDHVAHGALPTADVLDQDGLFVGNHHVPLDTEFDLLLEVLATVAP